MKRVGIITLFNNNYNCGGILQALALQEVIKKFGYECEIINYKRNILSEPINENKLKKLIKKVNNIESKGDVINLLLKPMDKFFNKKISNEILERKTKYKKFIDSNVSYTKEVDHSTIYKINENFDIFVCGSDQIWRPSTFDPNYYLAFAKDDKRKFSYAASIGANELTKKEKERIELLINKLNYISLRERSSINIIQSLTEKKVENVLDPTLLLEKDYWKKFVTNKTVKGKYIFSYLIGENNKNRDIVKKIAKKVGLPIVTIPGVSRILPYDFLYGNINMTSSAPNDFINLIANSSMVITDSFHATVFSIIFGKKVYVLERFKKSDRMSMNSRIYDLLDLFDMQENLLDEQKANKIEKIELQKPIKIDFSRWNQMKMKSLKYIEKGLNS